MDQGMIALTASRKTTQRAHLGTWGRAEYRREHRFEHKCEYGRRIGDLICRRASAAYDKGASVAGPSHCG
ncbi:hypothetical protein CF111_17740 [Aeromonas sobria]|nr:hypothetical protein CF111_17740 [Aeromonas sobria]